MGKRIPQGMRTSRGKYLRDKNFQGDCSQRHVTHTSWGSQVGCLAFRGYRMLCRVILGPRRIFYALPTYSMYDVLCIFTASACDHRYGLIFCLIVFFGLKIDYARIAQWKKITLGIIFNCFLFLKGTDNN